jgi:hypothetical protein
MESTEIIAWWGAILSSIVFVWEIYKWKSSGPKIRFSVQTGMQSINMPGLEGKRLVLVNVTNYGERPTTITNLGYLYFDSIWSWLRRRPDKAFVIPFPNTVQQLPFALEPGAVWTGMAIQDNQVEDMATKGRLYCMLYHSHDENPIRRRVVVLSNSKPNRTRSKTARVD